MGEPVPLRLFFAGKGPGGSEPLERVVGDGSVITCGPAPVELIARRSCSPGLYLGQRSLGFQSIFSALFRNVVFSLFHHPSTLLYPPQPQVPPSLIPPS